MSDKMLYIVRGLPGSGKSTLAATLAKSLSAPHFEEDMFLYKDGVYLWTPSRMENAVELCLRYCEMELVRGAPVVISNVFEDERMLEPYQAIADRFGYSVTYMVVENRRGGQNIHNVPDEAFEQMRADFQVRL